MANDDATARCFPCSLGCTALRTRDAQRMASMSQDRRRHKIVSISFEPNEIEWTDSLVRTLKSVGYRHVSRSEVVNVALSVLRRHVRGRTPYEILHTFLDRDDGE
jgi:hypothetical protein